MLLDGEDAFLPTDNDKIKAQIKELQFRLNSATEKRRKLRRQLIEEDLSFVVVSKMAEVIKDPTRIKADELEGIQKDIYDQMMKVGEQCTVQEMISYHRLAGRTIFDFNSETTAIRLETFYNKAYRESFYVLFSKHKPGKIYQHTIPHFIPLEHVGSQFLPHDLQTFLRIIHDSVQAFVVRREIFNEIESLSRDHPIKVYNQKPSITQIVIEVQPNIAQALHISLLYQNYASSFPTQVDIRGLFRTLDTNDFTQLSHDMMHGNINDVLLSLL